MVCFYDPGVVGMCGGRQEDLYSSLGQPALTNYRTSGSGRPGFKKKKKSMWRAVEEKKKDLSVPHTQTCVYSTAQHNQYTQNWNFAVRKQQKESNIPMVHHGHTYFSPITADLSSDQEVFLIVTCPESVLLMRNEEEVKSRLEVSFHLHLTKSPSLTAAVNHWGCIWYEPQGAGEILS